MRAVQSVWGTLHVQSWLAAPSAGTDQQRAGAWMGRTKFKVKCPVNSVQVERMSLRGVAQHLAEHYPKNGAFCGHMKGFCFSFVQSFVTEQVNGNNFGQ